MAEAEKQYIDRAPFIRDLTAMKREYTAISLDGIIKALKEAPAADAVEVVRCEHCKHYGTTACAMDTYAFDVVEEGFCSYGERKEQDNDNNKT